MSYETRHNREMRTIPNTMSGGQEPNLQDDMIQRNQVQRMGSASYMRRSNKNMDAIERAYAAISARMCEAIEFHAQLADYFCFMGLQGFKRMAEYQYMKECAEARKVHKRYIDIHHKILPANNPEEVNLIPQEFARYTTNDINDSIIPKYVKNAMQKYLDWEEETKQILQEQHDLFMQINEPTDADFVKELIAEVEKEIKKVSRLFESLNGTGYDVNAIMTVQPDYHTKYKKKYKEHFTPTAMRKAPYYPDEWDEQYEDDVPYRRNTMGYDYY